MTEEQEAMMIENSPFAGNVLAKELQDAIAPKKNTGDISFGDTTVRQAGRDYVISIPIPEGMVEFAFTEISRSPQSLNAIISTHFNDYKEGLQPSFTQRINLNSASATTDLRRSLDDIYGKKHKWAMLLNKATNALRATFLETQKPINLAGMKYAAETFLLKPFLQKDVSNMVFGDSEVGKTYFCIRLAASLAIGVEFLGYEAPKGIKTLFLDYEDSLSTFNNRLFEVSAGLGLKKEDITPYLEWYKPDGSMRDMRETVARLVEDNDYGLIVIDAGSNAAGGSPNDEQIVVDMFNALEGIPCTKLIIHHEPKNTLGLADNKAYYGTTFWRALTRIAWRLTLENEEDGKVIKATMTKNSNLGRIKPILYRQKWESTTRTDEPTPFVSFTTVDDFQPTEEQKIMTYLTEAEKATTNEIAEATGLTRTTTQRRLQELLERDVIDRERDTGHARRIYWKKVVHEF